MRSYLRETCEDIWVIDCSPEGHQPEVNTRIFQGVQQPVCIVMVSRSGSRRSALATVQFRALPRGRREEKFAALSKLRLDDGDWIICPSATRGPFLPESTGSWATFPKLEEFFSYNGAGIQAKRTWVFAPDKDSLRRRWYALIDAPIERKEDLFHPTLRDGVPADRHIRSIVSEPVPGFSAHPIALIDQTRSEPEMVMIGFRSFDRQFLLVDRRTITQPNDFLWSSLSSKQIFAVALSSKAPTSGPALTFSAGVPEGDFYKGSFSGRVFPMWSDGNAKASNVRPALLAMLSKQYGRAISPEDVMSYVAAVAAHPAYTARFQQDFLTPGLRIPLTAEERQFEQAIIIGQHVLWLHTYGERLTDATRDRPAKPPRLPVERRPTIPKDGTISEEPEEMPDVLNYDAGKHRLLVGHGFIDNVTPAMWAYEVSGKQVLVQWFSYRKRNRERPIIGDRRPPSKLGDIQPDHWLPEYTTELLNVLNVLGLLIDLEPAQAALLEAVCSGPLITEANLKAAGALAVPMKEKKPAKAKQKLPQLF